MKISNLLFALLILFSVSSCKDECKDVNCNFGACDDGTCICDTGYEGANCDTEMRTKFLGAWEGPANCSIEDALDSLFIKFEKFDSDINQIKLNIDDGDAFFIAKVSGNTFSFKDQVSEGLLFQGNGSFTNEIILFKLDGEDIEDGEDFSCTFNLYKK